MSGPNLGNLVTLIKRLEAATSRLEDLAESTTDTEVPVNGPQGSAATAGSVGPSAQTSGSAPAAKSVVEELPPPITGFDSLINGDIKAFVNKSESLGGLVAEQANCVLKAFLAQRKFLLVTTKAKKPDMQSSAYTEILKELQAAMGPVDDIRVANRASPLFNHLNAVADGLVMLAWVTVEPKPADSVNAGLDSAKFYGNRVHKEYKDKDLTHTEWLQAYYRIFNSLSSYIKEYYPTGVTWNNRDGVDPMEALRKVQSGETTRATPSAYAPPPPPPLPNFDGPTASTNGTSKKSGTTDMGAVFDDLSKGESVTAGLRKVDPSQQTHKNPSLRSSSEVPIRSDSGNSNRGKSPLPSKRPKPESMRTKKPPRKELDGNKWIIENFDNPAETIEIDAKVSHSILITRCTKTTIHVRNKANAISIDSSSQVSLIIDSLVSSVDVIKTPRFELQVLGTLPTILLDQVDGATIYLSRKSLGTEFFTSKCTAVNINVPGRSDDDDYRECPLPEQIKTVIRNGQPLSEIVEHAG